MTLTLTPSGQTNSKN